ncbi:MAG TPA: hypothetical protein VK843_06485 [Planctomycetota bacterium]|nr:hypothetical protein [Planctomycetota bacterium]
MKSSSRAFLLSAVLALCAGSILSSLPVGCSHDAQASSTWKLAEFQVELLELASKTASALPSNPHVKTRSRLQEEVATACLALEQPERAMKIVEAIENWRRGTGYADIASWCASHGKQETARHCIDLARKVADTTEAGDAEGESSQTWRRDRIRAGIARACLVLGESKQAAELEAGLAGSEVGSLHAAKAKLQGADAPETLDARLLELDPVLATGDFDQLRDALGVCASLFDRFYADAERRTRAQEKIVSSWTKLPAQVRIELMFELTGIALDHADRSLALTLVDDTQRLVEGSRWLPEDQIPLAAKLAGLRQRAGGETQARTELAAALAAFDAHRQRIVDIRRAAVLRSIAEAYQSMGDTAAALELYARAVEEGIANPNSRPRAEDLAATCCSMAQHAIAPGPQLWSRLREIHQGLKSPW